MDTVLYGSASELRATLEYDFLQEKNYSYKGVTMDNSFGVSVIFGRSDMQKITEPGAGRASDLLKDLVHAKIIEAVTGYGKGRLRLRKLLIKTIIKGGSR